MSVPARVTCPEGKHPSWRRWQPGEKRPFPVPQLGKKGRNPGRGEPNRGQHTAKPCGGNRRSGGKLSRWSHGPDGAGLFFPGKSQPSPHLHRHHTLRPDWTLSRLQGLGLCGPSYWRLDVLHWTAGPGAFECRGQHRPLNHGHKRLLRWVGYVSFV